MQKLKKELYAKISILGVLMSQNKGKLDLCLKG